MKQTVTIDGNDIICDHVSQRELIDGPSALVRFTDWFGKLSDFGQMLVWLTIGLPVTAVVVMIIAYMDSN